MFFSIRSWRLLHTTVLGTGLYFALGACAQNLEHGRGERSPAPASSQATEAVVSENGTQTSDWFQKPGSEGFYMLMNKSKNELALHSFRDSKVLKLYRAITGSAAGDKEREGDFKTPEGIYFIESRVPKSQMAKLHGPAAFELNYPNSIDRIFSRTGKGIWIHGVDNDERMKKRFDTRGCVAVSNPDILDLGAVLTLKDTPIVIFEKEIPDVKIGLEEENGPLHERVREWAKAWASKNTDGYLAFYSPDFYSRRMNYEQWKRYKTRLTKQYKDISVELSDIKILKHGKYSVAIFRQKYDSGVYRVSGRKRLYLIGEGPGALILSEESIDDTISAVY